MPKAILLDFGHPMNTKTMENIIKSLENVLVLSLAFSQTSFGISVLNSDFAVVFCESEPRNDYSMIINLNDFITETNKRVTVQQFRDLLTSSIEAILREVQGKFREAGSLGNQSREELEITVFTKKTAWVLAGILTSVINKQQKDKISADNFKIVQIIDETQQETCGVSEKNEMIDCIFCTDDKSDLDRFFKGWLLNPQQHLRILVSKDANLEMECEIEDCVVNPMAFRWKSDSLGDIRNKEKIFLIGTSTQVRSLEIISRLPVNGLCPTLVFGTPRRITAHRGTGSQTNSIMFKELCRELSRTGEGLLAKSLPTERTGLRAYHFLTSDGDMILMNDVAPDELELPTRAEFSDCVESCEDEPDASVIRDCLKKITFLNEFKPKNFSSGICEFLRDHFNRMEQTENSSARFDTNLAEKTVPRKENPTSAKCSHGNKNTPPNDRRKRPRLDSKKELENVHPALLSSKVVEKYRKISKHAFEFPELEKEFM